MRKRFWGWALLYGALGVALLILGHYSGAQAHSWYARTNCCSGTDCNAVPLDADWVSPTARGYHIKLTAAQAKTINPYATLPVDQVIPWGNSRIKAPPKLQPGETYGEAVYHLCIPSSWSGVYCLFAVPGL